MFSRLPRPREVKVPHLNPSGDDWTTTVTLDLSFWDWLDLAASSGATASGVASLLPRPP